MRPDADTGHRTPDMRHPKRVPASWNFENDWIRDQGAAQYVLVLDYRCFFSMIVCERYLTEKGCFGRQSLIILIAVDKRHPHERP
jgi:hypothetical protein